MKLSLSRLKYDAFFFLHISILMCIIYIYILECVCISICL